MCSCTVIIVNYYSWDLLTACLEALSLQTFQDFKVIVADNSISKNFPKRILDIPLEITVILNDSNLGFAKGNNTIIWDFVDTPLVVCLNPDTLPESRWLEKLVQSAKKYPDIDCFGSRLVSSEHPEVLDGDGDNYHVSGLAWRYAHGFKRSLMKPVGSREIFSPCAAAAMYRTEIFIKLNGFDEDFFCYFEDVDLGFRLRLCGHRALQVGTAIVYHLGSATSGGQDSDFASYHGQRNLIWTFVKNMPGLLFWTFLPLHFGLNLLTIFLYSLRGRSRIILKAKFDALKGLPKMIAKRKKIQKMRTASIAEIFAILNRDLLPLKRPTR